MLTRSLVSVRWRCRASWLGPARLLPLMIMGSGLRFHGQRGEDGFADVAIGGQRLFQLLQAGLAELKEALTAYRDIRKAILAALTMKTEPATHDHQGQQPRRT